MDVGDGKIPDRPGVEIMPSRICRAREFREKDQR